MRTNNKQKIEELKKILQQIVDKSTTIQGYDIDTQVEDNELLVNVALCDEDGVVKWVCGGTYLEVWCEVKLVLYPLL